MTSIVISYRRADTGQIAGRIFDRLEAHFGRGSVFMDIDGIPIGADFHDRVESVLGDCDVVIALVGPHWADGGAHHDRLSDEADWVRIEVETALANKVPVVPVLIDQTQFPPAADVPASVRDIVFKQAARVDTGIDFGPHMDRLIRSIDGFLKTPKARTPDTSRGAREESHPQTETIAPSPASVWDSLRVISNLFTLNGRLGVGQWWWFFPIHLIHLLLLFIFFGGVHTHDSGLDDILDAMGAAGFIGVAALVTWIALAAAVRRVHDRNIVGVRAAALILGPAVLMVMGSYQHGDDAWYLVAPALAGFLWAIAESGFVRGTSGPNRYGPDPRDKSTAAAASVRAATPLLQGGRVGPPADRGPPIA